MKTQNISLDFYLMKVLVPLAGPEYFKNGNIKGLTNTSNGPFLLSTLRSRHWFKSIQSSNYCFVLHDSKEARHFADIYLKDWFNDCRVCFISHFTQGAAMSSLCGLGMLSDDSNEPIIIDLADIYFETDIIPFDNINLDISGIAFSFKSSLPKYSYFKLDQDGLIIEAKEKAVISDNASAGVYCFRNPTILLEAIAYTLKNNKYMYNNLYYVCPLFNGLVSKNFKSITYEVNNVMDIK